VSRFLKSIGALYALDYDRRLKTCVYCECQFTDVTKRNLKHTCDWPCQNASMVAKRRANGSYEPTTVSNEKRATTMREAYASGRRQTSVEQRKKFSETMKRTWQEDKIDTSKHWSKTLEGKARLSKSALGRKLGPQPKMSLGAQKRLRTKRETLYTSANGGIRDDLGMYFRSNWEANFARILNVRGTRWEYESKTFQLEPSLSYTPDFYVIDEDAFYELKGRMDDKSKRQFELMREKFPQVTLHVIDGVKYRELRLEYKNRLSNWEGK